MSSEIVLGSAFFTNFFAQFTYEESLDTNKVRLTLAKNVVPGTYLGDQTGSASDIVVPTPTPVVDPTTPTVDPTPLVSNATTTNDKTVNIMLLSAELVIFMCLMACMLYLCVNKLTCCGQGRKTIGEYNQLQTQNNSAHANGSYNPMSDEA